MAVKSNHWVSDLWKNKGMKVPVIITAMAIAAFSVFILCKAVFGYPVKIAGFEVNQPTEKAKVEPQTSPTLSVLPPTDSVKINPIQNKQPSSQKTSKPKEKKAQPTQKDTQVVNSITGKNVNTGTNNGIIGDDGTININNQPVLTDSHKQSILKRVQTLRSQVDTSIIMLFIGSGTNAGQYIVDLKKFLQEKGYIVEQAISLHSFSGINFSTGVFTDNRTKIIHIGIGNL